MAEEHLAHEIDNAVEMVAIVRSYEDDEESITYDLEGLSGDTAIALVAKGLVMLVLDELGQLWEEDEDSDGVGED